jgi:hypothetical protein
MITLAIVLSAACSAFRGDPAVQVSAQDATLNTRWYANLASPGNLAGAVQMSGSASMAPSPDSASTHITLNLANAAPGGQHPWAVRWGQCGSGKSSAVFGSTESYRPLEVDSKGHANANASAQLRTPSAGSYFVVVYASAANSETVVACGNLAPPTQ